MHPVRSRAPPMSRASRELWSAIPGLDVVVDRVGFTVHARRVNFGEETWTRARLLACGMTDNQIRRAVTRGVLSTVRPGVYVARSVLEGSSADVRHLHSVRAASVSAGVVSHQSAALVHGFSLWEPDLTLVHVTVDRAAGGRITTRRHVHVGPLAADDVVSVDGLQVTSAARTIADLSRTLDFEAAVCVGDSALNSGSTTIEAIRACLDSTPTRGGTSARRAVDFLDPRSESVGESRSRVMLRALGMPAPELQIPVLDPSGRLIGRPDFLFDRQGVIGEFDGFVKYSSLVPKGSSPSRVAFAEKRREDEFRSYGWMVVRWVWSELATPDVVGRRLRRAFDIAATMPTPCTRRR